MDCSLLEFITDSTVKVVWAVIRTDRWDARLSHGDAIDPLGIVLSLALSKLRVVTSAITGREQLHVGCILVDDLGSLCVLEAKTRSVVFIN